MNLFKSKLRIKDINIKSLETGDKSAYIKLSTVYPQDVDKLKKLLDKQEVEVSIDG